MRTSIPITDVVTGQNAAIAILGAMFHHHRTGEGQYIDCAMLDAAVALNGHLALGYLMTGRTPVRIGNTNPIASPSEVFQCTDGQLIIAAGNQGQFHACCEVLGVPELARQSEFATNSQRVANRNSLREKLSRAVAQRSRADLISALEAAGVPCGPINDMAQVFADPQTLHRGLALTLRHSRRADIPTLRSPLRFSQTPVQHNSPPQLGEHTIQVLRDELQLDQAAIGKLAQCGIV
ncbi:Acetyl-CoA:oxalate CoA-transferase [bioreactor metagenome]|uniref:Acetyl-CoA:oxalate CoA-transferase n=1 Tax=bioreactor metagenome TaxID=1076179 RepID=A0A645B027_9ZZZZ